MFKKLLFDDQMNNFLDYISPNSIIAQILRNGSSTYINDEGNCVSMVSDEIDVVSFLPRSKYEKIEDVWNKGRVKIKVGRFVRKFIKELSLNEYSINDQEIEKFVNTYKSYFSRDVEKMKIVEGADIMKYYLEENYYISGGRYGTLWNSCMRQRERNSFMELYAKNPESVKMLVFFSDDDKVRARALLWDDVTIHENKEEKYKFMDRIYYFYDHDVNFFKHWAKENGYITKWEQNARSELFFDIGGECQKLKMYVNLKVDTNVYPYLDTLKYYNVSKSRFSNASTYTHDYTLIQSNGRLESDRCEEDELEPDWGEDDYEDDDGPF